MGNVDCTRLHSSQFLGACVCDTPKRPGRFDSRGRQYSTIRVWQSVHSLHTDEYVGRSFFVSPSRTKLSLSNLTDVLLGFYNGNIWRHTAIAELKGTECTQRTNVKEYNVLVVHTIVLVVRGIGYCVKIVEVLL